MKANTALSKKIDQILTIHKQILKLAEEEDWQPLLVLCQERYTLCQDVFKHENYPQLKEYSDELQQIKRLDSELMESFKPIFNLSLRKIYNKKRQVDGCREYRNTFSLK